MDATNHLARRVHSLLLGSQIVAISHVVKQLNLASYAITVSYLWSSRSRCGYILKSLDFCSMQTHEDGFCTYVVTTEYGFFPNAK